MTRRLRLTAVFVIGVFAAGCINVFWTTRAQPLRATDLAYVGSIGVSVRAHLADGSTVVFENGAGVLGRNLTGYGVSYPLLSPQGFARESVPLDSIVGVESFRAHAYVGRSIVVSAAATAVGGIATIGILKALFGSCPTVYSDTGSGLSIEAEGFSYALAPLLEHRDVDRLRARPDSDGVVRLELRNEALETHFINHVELLSVRHGAGARVMPDPSGRLVAVTDVQPVTAARDRAGRDVRVALAAADGNLFASDSGTMARARVGDLDDWIDLDIADLPSGDSMAVVLRLRNSLLNTVLLYEVILSGPGAADWVATDLETIGTVVDLSDWYKRTMGMNVALLDEGAASARRTGVRLGDVGPIAFRDVAVVLPRPKGNGPARVRLQFVSDNWRIDYAAIAGRFSRPRERGIAVSNVVVPTPSAGGAASSDTAAVGVLRATDDRYLETHPGQRMVLEFAPPPQASGADSATTFLIAWQGWYREWIRPAWITDSTRRTRFVPGDSAVLDALTRWRGKQVEFERAFHSSKVPVR